MAKFPWSAFSTPKLIQNDPSKLQHAFKVPFWYNAVQFQFYYKCITQTYVTHLCVKIKGGWSVAGWEEPRKKRSLYPEFLYNLFHETTSESAYRSDLVYSAQNGSSSYFSIQLFLRAVNPVKLDVLHVLPLSLFSSNICVYFSNWNSNLAIVFCNPYL